MAGAPTKAPGHGCVLARSLRGLLGMPAAPVLLDEPVVGQPGEDPVEVVLLDAHLLGDLRDRDPGLGADERERLGATGARALRPPTATAAAAVALGALGRGLRTRTARGRRACAPGGSAPEGVRRDAVERRRGGLETLILIDERLEFLQPRADLASLLVQEVCHYVSPFRHSDNYRHRD